jgi:pyruvate,orthophosphate dikinase
MDGLPVTIRLLDPPLHEFLPNANDVDEAFAKDVGMTLEECKHAIERMHEVNPMLGLRGCRLGVVMPELIEMQARALAEASLNNKYKKKLDPRPEVMIPLIGSANEYKSQSKLIKDTFAKVFAERPGETADIKIGTMIEVPRAALTAHEIAKAGAEFFSYGTNDLTQMTYGFSRDDVGGYLPTYLKEGILEVDPFQTIDPNGVGQLIKMSAEAGRQYFKDTNSKNKFKAGVCGEHGGDPKSVRFFARNGLNYVSCSPFRVPVARLAAAQAAVEIEAENLAKA